VNLQTIQEYEATRLHHQTTNQASHVDLMKINSKEFPQTESGLLQHKQDLENAISKFRADLQFNKQQQEFMGKNIDALELSLTEERKKIHSLMETGEGASIPRQAQIA
jgi:hypothetical protein